MIPDAGPMFPDAGPAIDAGTPEDDVIVWAHSADTLFALNPRTLTVTPVGMFSFADGGVVPGMTDLAVNKSGEIFTCSRTDLYRVDPRTAVTTHIAALGLESGVQFNGMTFLPEGVIDAEAETLVGATDAGDYYRVDPVTGTTTRLGTYSNGYLSSGDIVSVVGAGTFATVKRDDLTTDLLVRLDPATGTATRIGDGIGYRRIFGVGYWRSRLYGFVADGTLVEINIETGVGTPVDGETGSDQFWGAGVTTRAPVAPF